MELKEFCSRCRTVTPSKATNLPNGTEFTCAVCGAQVDYLQNEYDEDDFGCCDLCGGELLGDEYDGICGICWDLEDAEFDDD